MPDAEPFFDTNIVLYALSADEWRKGTIERRRRALHSSADRIR
jgi:predicted nucleic acid-binding protein